MPCVRAGGRHDGCQPPIPSAPRASPLRPAAGCFSPPEKTTKALPTTREGLLVAARRPSPPQPCIQRQARRRHGTETMLTATRPFGATSPRRYRRPHGWQCDRSSTVLATLRTGGATDPRRCWQTHELGVSPRRKAAAHALPRHDRTADSALPQHSEADAAGARKQRKNREKSRKRDPSRYSPPVHLRYCNAEMAKQEKDAEKT